MVEKFLSRTVFTSQEDYIRNFRIRVPADFNFAYDVVDAYAAEEPSTRSVRGRMTGRRGSSSPLPT